MKKIAVGDLGEFWYGDYKEPFEQLEGGVPGHPVGVVLKADDGRLLCAWCGKTYENLAAHVTGTHKTPAREYKNQVGLLNKSALVSERLRLIHSRQAMRTGLGSRPDDIHMYEAARGTTPRAKGHRSGMAKAEWLNKTGTCYAQALAVGRTVLAETGRLSERTLRKHGIFETTVRRYFGDMDGFRRTIGLQPLNFRRSTETELLSALRNLAGDLGHTPVRSDLRRYGLARPELYARRFGSYAEACRRAGLLVAIPLARRDDFDGLALETYATLGTVTQTAHHLHVDRKAVEAVLTKYGAPFVDRLGSGGTDTARRREWAADMARRLAGVVAAA